MLHFYKIVGYAYIQTSNNDRPQIRIIESEDKDLKKEFIKFIEKWFMSID